MRVESVKRSSLPDRWVVGPRRQGEHTAERVRPAGWQGCSITPRAEPGHGDPPRRQGANRMIGYIIGLIITGLIIGALARLVIPGRQSMSILVTIAIGVVAALVAGLIAHALGLGAILTYVVAVVLAAAAVYFISGSARARGRTTV